MDFIADILLAGGAIAAAIYCLVLSRRLTRFGQLEGGVGGAITGLAQQVQDMSRMLEQAQVAAKASSNSLELLTVRAEGVAERLELMLAAFNNLPEEGPRDVRRVRVLRTKTPRTVAAE
jgi:anaerobic glycerol-3-phosphate dehydrogenase